MAERFLMNCEPYDGEIWAKIVLKTNFLPATHHSMFYVYLLDSFVVRIQCPVDILHVNFIYNVNFQLPNAHIFHFQFSWKFGVF